MASIQLGNIVSSIAGSVGGTTFRRTQRGQIMYNKQNRQNKSANSKNSVKNKIGSILQKWGSLEETDRELWNIQASLYPQKNKFGEVVYFTGRQFFTKLNSQLIPINRVSDIEHVEPTNFSGYVVGIDSLLDMGEINLELSEPNGDFTILVQAYRLRPGANTKPTKKFFNTAIVFEKSKKSHNIFGEVAAQFGFLKVGDKFGFNIYFLNNSGFKSSVSAITTVLRNA